MRNDFIGFSFDGIHSSSLNIIRVSDGNRYEETILPEIEDTTLTIPGMDGDLYYNSRYGKKSFSIQIAYDNMLEIDFRKMVKLFSTKKVCPLIFDERPYKVYLAKLESPIQLDYVCFDQPKKTIGETISNSGVRVVSRENGEIIREDITPYIIDYTKKQRVYKGDATIDLIATYPFAHSQFKTLEQYSTEGYTNIEEWAETSRILSQATYEELELDRVRQSSAIGYNYEIPVYNAGDIDTGYQLYIPYSGGLTSNGIISASTGNYIYISSGDNILAINPFTSRLTKIREDGILINTKNHLIEGVKVGGNGALITTGEIYNNYIEAGDFGTIKSLDYDLDNSHLRQAIYLNCDQGAEAQIFYNYLYY